MAGGQAQANPDRSPELAALDGSESSFGDQVITPAQLSALKAQAGLWITRLGTQLEAAGAERAALSRSERSLRPARDAYADSIADLANRRANLQAALTRADTVEGGAYLEEAVDGARAAMAGLALARHTAQSALAKLADAPRVVTPARRVQPSAGAGTSGSQRASPPAGAGNTATDPFANMPVDPLSQSWVAVLASLKMEEQRFRSGRLAFRIPSLSDAGEAQWAGATAAGPSAAQGQSTLRQAAQQALGRTGDMRLLLAMFARNPTIRPAEVTRILQAQRLLEDGTGLLRRTLAQGDPAAPLDLKGAMALEEGLGSLRRTQALVNRHLYLRRFGE
ncbi:MAG: hypothetical protein ACPGOY_03530 [Rhodospirillaceae bacterium]